MPNPVTGKIGLTELPRSEFSPPGFAVQSYDLDVGVAAASIAPGGLGPSKIGHPVVNKTGSSIPLGTLVFINSWDLASGLSTINLAAAQFLAERAMCVMIGTPGPNNTVIAGPCANNAQGIVALQYTLTGQNTNAGNVGDAVWLSGTTPGAYTLTEPVASNTIAQLIGRIAIKSATVGVINLEILQGAVPIAFGSNEIQPGAVGAVALSANMARIIRSNQFTVPATGSVEIGIPMDKAGTITGLQINGNTALATNGTNYVTWAVNNRTQSLLLTQAVAADSTNTGGTAVVQYAATPLVLTATGGNLVVAANDYICLLATVTGTLGAVLTGTFSVVVAPS